MKWLTGRGAAAALAIGAATVWGLGWRGFVVLLAFLVSGSLLTEGGGRRNARQVLANGGVAAAAGLLGHWMAFAGAVAAATADTWSSEIGRHSPVPPRLVTSWKQVPAGTDGGMTLPGTLGGVLGAVFIAAVSYALGQRALTALTTAGVVGMVLDSLLGATVQGKARWMDNDAVNLAATLAGAACAGLLS